MILLGLNFTQLFFGFNYFSLFFLGSISGGSICHVSLLGGYRVEIQGQEPLGPGGGEPRPAAAGHAEPQTAQPAALGAACGGAAPTQRHGLCGLLALWLGPPIRCPFLFFGVLALGGFWVGFRRWLLGWV